MSPNKSNFEYLLSPEIVVMGDYKNDDYHERVKNHIAEIEKAWEKEQERRNKKLFNGNILNLAIIEQQENKLLLQCHPVEYKHYLAQRSGIDLGITPLAVSGIVFYNQEKDTKIFFIGKRSESVTQYPGYFEFIPSGSIDANNITPNHSVEYTTQLIVELKEELGISVNEVLTQNAFCLIFDEIDHVYDIGIEIEVSNSIIKTHEAEYTSAEKLPEKSVSEYMKGENIVNTSRKLFEAWRGYRPGGIK